MVVIAQLFNFVVLLEVGGGMDGGDDGGDGSSNKVGCKFFVSAMIVGKIMVGHVGGVQNMQILVLNQFLALTDDKIKQEKNKRQKCKSLLNIWRS